MSAYRVVAERDDANSADIVIHTSMVNAVLDMVGLGSEEPDFGGPIGWTIDYATEHEEFLVRVREDLKRQDEDARKVAA